MHGHGTAAHLAARHERRIGDAGAPAAFRVGLDAGEFRRILADAVGTGGALDVGVVALSREDPLGGEACFLELPVGVGGDDEVVAPARPVVQLAVQGRGLHPQIVHSGMVRPIGPAVLFP